MDIKIFIVENHGLNRLISGFLNGKPFVLVDSESETEVFLKEDFKFGQRACKLVVEMANSGECHFGTSKGYDIDTLLEMTEEISNIFFPSSYYDEDELINTGMYNFPY